MFPPSLSCESSISFNGSLLSTTMRSADSLAHRIRIYSKASLGKANILVSNPAISTTSVLLFRDLDFSMMCYLIRPNSLCIWFLFSLPSTWLGVSSDTAVWLTSMLGSLQTTLSLTLLPGTTPALTGLSPFGTLNFMSYIHHSRHTHMLWMNGVSSVGCFREARKIRHKF